MAQCVTGGPVWRLCIVSHYEGANPKNWIMWSTVWTEKMLGQLTEAQGKNYFKLFKVKKNPMIHE